MKFSTDVTEYDIHTDEAKDTTTPLSVEKKRGEQAIILKVSYVGVLLTMPEVRDLINALEMLK